MWEDVCRLHKNITPFYRGLEHLQWWCGGGVLEPVPYRYQGMTLVHFGVPSSILTPIENLSPRLVSFQSPLTPKFKLMLSST